MFMYIFLLGKFLENGLVNYQTPMLSLSVFVNGCKLVMLLVVDSIPEVACCYT